MNNEGFDMLVASIKEAGDIRSGKREASRVFEIDAPEIKSVREALRVSQREFALMIGVSVSTSNLRNCHKKQGV